MRDLEFSYEDGLGRSCTHRLRIKEVGGSFIVLVTDQSEKHKCGSVTNTIDYLAPALFKAMPTLWPRLTTFIEHYEYADKPASFDVVQFREGKPEWTRITQEKAWELLGNGEGI